MLANSIAASAKLKEELMTEVQRLQQLVEEEKKVQADTLVAQTNALKLAHAFGQYLLHSHLRYDLY